MKKIYTLAALAMVAIVACNKEIETSIEILPVDKGEVSIVAKAPAETKTTIDGLQVKWATGDHIAVIDVDNGAHDFTLDDGVGTTSGEFSGSLSGKEAAGFAVYPYTANSAFDGSNLYVDYPTTYAYNAVTVPMYALEVSPGEYDFDHIGGAFQIQYTNVPDDASSFVFTATSDITGTAAFDLSDAVITSNNGTEVTVTGLPDDDALTFFIPVPAGSYSFSVKLLDSGDNVIAGSEKTVTSPKAVSVGHVVPLRAIKVKADKGETLWSEDFGTYSANDVPGSGEGDGWAGATIDYSVTNGTSDTKIYAENLAGGTSPELLVGKSGGKFVATGVPTGNWTEFTLDYYCNKNIPIEVSIASSTVSDAEDLGSNHYRRSITIPSAASTMDITFNSISSNARLDNILLVAGVPDPGITVTTGSATDISTAEGTTATLNGTLALINGADNAKVSEAGFYYKLTSAAGFTKVTCGSAPTSTTSFSYNLTGLTKGSEYTYYAYAIYNSGSEVTGEASAKTFTPTQSGGGSANETMTFSSLYNANTTLDGTTINGTNFSVLFNKRDGGTATQYYTNGTAVRWYGGGTLVISALGGKTITSIVLSFGATKGNAITASVGSYDDGAADGTGTWSGSASSVTFTQAGTTGHDRIKAITVTYIN